ncbi:dienelactone hydrolase family protein [Streptomyces griseoviridis]|uniref:Dienelactone hydrolase n=1 Tax=Streptomyces griseoviridis TaxID=45398 RepID=A0A3Q9KPV0_STRGD|nr:MULTISPECIES: dienelactone hydrolase family protein [Streptomyces]AZS83191.1 dienelactone hydrolase family protein [Streptomyces griseoviridis]MDH6695934.1 carboxymethylenebutenolidase [Streptomyces sp. MAA16]QCN89955.1 dienelactone hydrolase [Streptomyces griseoviridis]
MTSVQGTAVDITTEDGVADAYLAHPDDGLPHPGVLLYQDAFGLRPQLRSMADRLAAAGYTVLVPNVFYRSGRTPLFDLPEFIDLSARPEIFGQIGPVMGALTAEMSVRDAGSYLQWLAESPLVADGPVALTGYCMGARLALLTAGTYPARVAAAAGFHGGRLATDQPDSPHLVAGNITAELYFGHADEDSSMPPEQQRLLEETLTAAGVRHRCEVYPGAHHGYTQADTDAYDEKATERHWAALLDLLARTF